MVADLLTTERVSANRQYDHWRDAVRATHEAWDMPARSHATFHGEVRRVDLGPAEVLACRCDPCDGRRGRSELASTDRAAIGVLFLLEGRERLRSADREAYLEGGRFTLWDTTRPLTFHAPERLAKVTLMLPAEVVASSLPGHARHLGRVFDATSGCGALLLAQLHTLSGLPSRLQEVGRQAALRAAVELLAAAVAEQVGSATPQSERLLDRALAYLDAHLGDPDLTIAAVARALGVSRRRLDRAFADGGRSASRTLWARRLERCRRDLVLEPDESLSVIAYRWGFSDAAHFSRAFRQAHGTSPSVWRASRAIRE